MEHRSIFDGRAAPSVPRWVCGIDVGGTFTDAAAIDLVTGTWSYAKVLTSRPDPAVGVQAAVRAAVPDHRDESVELCHATTLATNALIERRGARTGLITTRGFADVIDIGRETRYDIYDLKVPLVTALVPKHLRIEIGARTSPDGAIVAEVEKAEVETARRFFEEQKVKAVAICLINSYANSTLEHLIAEIMSTEKGNLFLSPSSVVALEVKEYERFTTAIVNAYVGPLMESYLSRVQSFLKAQWPNSLLRVMLSNGGMASVDTAIQFPVRILESGPAAGVVAAAHFGSCVEKTSLLAFDMGGTTAKLCVIADGAARIGESFEAARINRFKKGSGFPIVIPSIDLVEIGAGGGSIASIDQLGLLRVGPESAEADPGPACYGHGGQDPTVTDAAVVLGYIGAKSFLGGNMHLDEDASTRAIARIAPSLKTSVARAAWAIYDQVTENMATAARLHIAERGHDPRWFVLVATGGAGPVHACNLAMKLGISTVICPPRPGVASAVGLVIAPPRLDINRSSNVGLDQLQCESLLQEFAVLEADARAQLAKVAADTDRLKTSLWLRMSYRGQVHTVEVLVSKAALESNNRSIIGSMYEDQYSRVYGQIVPDGTIQIVGLRLEVTGVPPVSAEMAVDINESELKSSDASHTRSVWGPSSEAFEEVAVINRNNLPWEVPRGGPLIIEDVDSTVVVARGWEVVRKKGGAVLLHFTGKDAAVYPAKPKTTEIGA